MKMDKTHFYKTGEQNDFEVTMNKILFSRLITSTDLIWPWVIVSSINSKVIAIINVFGSLALCYILLVQQKNCHLLCFPRTEQSKQNPFQILLSWLHFGACSDFYNASSSSFNIFFSFLAPFVVSFLFLLLSPLCHLIRITIRFPSSWLVCVLSWFSSIESP